MLSRHNHMTKSHVKDHNFCTVTFDEMSIRKHLEYNKKLDQIDGFEDHGEHGRTKNVASKALVFMAIGIRKKWKQPIAFYFSGDHVTSDRLSVLIKNVLRECFSSGLLVAGTICDGDGVNVKALNTLGSTIDNPYFIVDGKEVVTMLDPPHLLKCFRNMFLKYNIEVTQDMKLGGKPVKGIAKWSHVEEFYKKDNNASNFVFAPALTKQHIQPNGKQKMKVKLAAQVFSHSVAAGLHAKISQGELPAEATATAMVVNLMDQLFDSVNGDTAD